MDAEAEAAKVEMKIEAARRAAEPEAEAEAVEAARVAAEAKAEVVREAEDAAARVAAEAATNAEESATNAEDAAEAAALLSVATAAVDAAQTVAEEGERAAREAAESELRSKSLARVVAPSWKAPGSRVGEERATMVALRDAVRSVAAVAEAEAARLAVETRRAKLMGATLSTGNTAAIVESPRRELAVGPTVRQRDWISVAEPLALPPPPLLHPLSPGKSPMKPKRDFRAALSTELSTPHAAKPNALACTTLDDDIVAPGHSRRLGQGERTCYSHENEVLRLQLQAKLEESLRASQAAVTSIAQRISSRGERPTTISAEVLVRRAPTPPASFRTARHSKVSRRRPLGDAKRTRVALAQAIQDGPLRSPRGLSRVPSLHGQAPALPHLNNGPVSPAR